MKNKNPIIVSVLGLALLAGLAFAATTATPPAAPAPAAPVPAGPSDDLRARFAEKLGLSADQQKKVDELRAQQRTALQALADNKDLTPEARREQARTLRENFRAQIYAVFTPEQQKQADEWREQMAERARGFGQERRFGSGRPGPAMGQPRGNPLAVVAMADRIKDRMAEKLQLTDQQRDQLEHLGRAYRAEQRDLAKKHLEAMRAVLTPDQQKKAEEMKHHFGRGLGMDERREGHRPPFASLDDEAEGPQLAGMDFGPGVQSSEVSEVD